MYWKPDNVKPSNKAIRLPNCQGDIWIDPKLPETVKVDFDFGQWGRVYAAKININWTWETALEIATELARKDGKEIPVHGYQVHTVMTPNGVNEKELFDGEWKLNTETDTVKKCFEEDLKEFVSDEFWMEDFVDEEDKISKRDKPGTLWFGEGWYVGVEWETPLCRSIRNNDMIMFHNIITDIKKTGTQLEENPLSESPLHLAANIDDPASRRIYMDYLLHPSLDLDLNMKHNFVLNQGKKDIELKVSKTPYK